MKKVPTFILFFFVVDIVLVLLYVFNRALHLPFDKVTVLLDLDGEGNLTTWYSSMQLFLTACFFCIFAFQQFNKQVKTSWLLMAWPLIFFTLSLDETAQIHEWVGRWSDVLLPGASRGHTLFWSTGIWMFLFGIPFFGCMLALTYHTKSTLSGKEHAVSKLLVGLLMFVAAVVGVEFVANLVSDGSAGHVLEISFEELGEMIGGTFFLWGAYLLSGVRTFRFPRNNLSL